MPLIKQSLELQLLAILKRSMSASDLETAQRQYCSELASAIDSYIRTATITVPPGQTVATAGTAAAQVGATTSPIIATIT